MKFVTTIDLWTEQFTNQYDCFNGAFSDGCKNNNLPYDTCKIVKNCNCIISNNENISISNKHQAIVFYSKNVPIRLLVANGDSDLKKCVENALNQQIGKVTISQIIKDRKVKFSEVDMREKPKKNAFNGKVEVDIGSCNRMSLLKSMLIGYYTDDQSNYGHFDSTRYIFDRNLVVEYKLKTDSEDFDILHECAFFNDLRTRAIIIQKALWEK